MPSNKATEAAGHPGQAVRGNGSGDLPFHEAADRVSLRLVIVHWIEALGRTLVPVMLAALAVFIGMRLLGVTSPAPEVAVAASVLVAWLAVCGAWAAMRRPEGFASLAFWDEKAGRKEEFASAYFFEGKTRMEVSERLHWESSRAALDLALPALALDLPLPRPGWKFLLPFLLIAFVLSPLLKPSVEAGDAPLSEGMQDKASEEADRMEKWGEQIEKMASLTEDEKAAMEKIQDDINKTADDLRKSADKTAREVLQELEERARAAEKLADRIGGKGDEWASEEMLREMSQHPDTAELADAVKDKNADRSADEADAIAEKLHDPSIRNETVERVDESLSRVMKKATDEDRERAVGQNVGNAADDMARKQPRAAGDDFDRLAEHFRHLAERERAEEKLRKLAEELRQSGSNIAGENLQSMKKLAGNQNSQSQANPMAGAPMEMNPEMSPMSPQQMQGQGKSLPIPGLKPGKAGQGKPMTFAPVPGGAQGKPMLIMPGNGNQPGQMMGMAPIPGTQAPGMAGMMAANGGLQAGNGSAPMDENATSAMDSQRSGLVTAQAGPDGDSAVRAVEGGERTEAAARDKQQQIVEFLKVEEDALEEKALPLSRKEHVLRYFTALRQRFEE